MAVAWENAKHHHEQRTEHKSCTKPEEIRNFPNGNVELLTFSGAEVGPLAWTMHEGADFHGHACKFGDVGA